MKKYIHYCWFGGKPLPKLAKKCIKSWKKYLPDYEIIEWNESNVNLEECPFIKEAYEHKKWAFVADYVRTKILYEKGGIYFDTDMKVTKDIKDLLDKKTILGLEDSGKIAVGFWYEKEPKSYLSTKLLEFYRGLKGFDAENPFAFSIPNILTSLIDDEKFMQSSNKIQNLKHDIIIYPREYFYPLSYNRENNIFTENTCMIHYYDASWVPKGERRTNRIYRVLGIEKGKKFIDFCRFTKRSMKKTAKVILFPVVIYRNNKRKRNFIENNKRNLNEALNKNKKGDILAIYRDEWLGISYATQEMFPNTLGIKYLNKQCINYYAEELVKKEYKMLIFSGFDLTWTNLVKRIKELKPNQTIKVVWHGSNAMNVEEYDWNVLKTILEFNKSGLIDSIGFVKKSLYEFYKEKDYKCEFLMNTLNLDKEKYIKEKDENNKNIKIGIYASGDRWVKNFYNQVSAGSLIENHVLDIIPKSDKTIEFANMINANIIGETKPISRENLLKRIASNDINVYVTFVECAPFLPLESLELGVPCITSNNHHYWENTELEKYLIVNAPDNIIEIKNKIKYALDNKEKIIEAYKNWKKSYDKTAKESISEFTK